MSVAVIGFLIAICIAVNLFIRNAVLAVLMSTALCTGFLVQCFLMTPEWHAWFVIVLDIRILLTRILIPCFILSTIVWAAFTAMQKRRKHLNSA